MLISHPQRTHPPTHGSIVTEKTPQTKSSAQLTLLSTSQCSGCCPAITSCENILHRSALFPPPTVPWKSLIGSWEVQFAPLQGGTTPTNPLPNQNTPPIILKLCDFFTNSLDVLTHKSPFGIWGILICLTTKLKVQSILSSQYVYFLWFFKATFYGENKREWVDAPYLDLDRIKMSAAVIDGFMRIRPPIGHMWVCWKITHPFRDCGSESDMSCGFSLVRHIVNKQDCNNNVLLSECLWPAGKENKSRAVQWLEENHLLFWRYHNLVKDSLYKV